VVRAPKPRVVAPAAPTPTPPLAVVQPPQQLTVEVIYGSKRTESKFDDKKAAEEK